MLWLNNAFYTKYCKLFGIMNNNPETGAIRYAILPADETIKLYKYLKHVLNNSIARSLLPNLSYFDLQCWSHYSYGYWIFALQSNNLGFLYPLEVKILNYEPVNTIYKEDARPISINQFLSWMSLIISDIHKQAI